MFSLRDTCSPDLAMFAIRMLADVKENAQPIGAKAFKENTYIDDVANSVSEPEEAKRTITEVDSILPMGKFSIKAWNSNPQEKEVDFQFQFQSARERGGFSRSHMGQA